MRWGPALLILLLASCIPRGEQPRPRPEPRRQTPLGGAEAPGDRETLQCHVALAREGTGFRVLEDRNFGGGCTAVGAVQLTEIGTPVTNLGAMRCPLARTFAAWVREAVQPEAQRRFRSPVRRIESFGTYACRPVNSQAGARLSEHSFANAVDIAAFVLADGRRVTVLDDWNGDREDARQFLRFVHREGCRRFSVGLSPESDAFHRNHLHFDLGRGPYCR
ncbi:MAG TPA: extensin family protein [Allosphingosinicella sp.]|nr:extensin family protein [Allosphingosinicella sp.]